MKHNGYICSHCDKKFMKSDALRMHKKRNHNKNENILSPTPTQNLYTETLSESFTSIEMNTSLEEYKKYD